MADDKFISNFLRVEAIIANPELLPPYITWRERAEKLGWKVWVYKIKDGKRLYVLRSPDMTPFINGKPVEWIPTGLYSASARFDARSSENAAWEDLPRTMNALIHPEDADGAR